jgi:hypothetical protein
VTRETAQAMAPCEVREYTTACMAAKIPSTSRTPTQKLKRKAGEMDGMFAAPRLLYRHDAPHLLVMAGKGADKGIVSRLQRGQFEDGVAPGADHTRCGDDLVAHGL